MSQIIIKESINIDTKVKEAIKTVRANIEFLGQDCKAIGITSCMDGEGKTMIAFQLALSMAKSKRRAVFVNANLRKDNDEEIYIIDKSYNGLSEYLNKQCKREEIILNTTIENLFIITAGRITENTSELISSSEFIELINKLKEEYDYIVVDTPAIAKVIDGAIAVRSCDGAILIMEPDVVPYELAQKCKKQIEVTGTKILGVVINKA